LGQGRKKLASAADASVMQRCRWITDVHIDRLLPCQASRSSLRRPHRSRKQNQQELRRHRSERYPYR
jgi:hypothetical protein